MLRVERVDLGHDGGELLLGLVQRLHLLGEHGLGRLERLALGLDLLGHVRVELDGQAPDAERGRGAGGLAHHLGVEARDLGVLLELLEHALLDVVLVEGLHLAQEVRLADLLLGARPVRRRLHERHDAAEHHHDRVRRLGVGLDLTDGAVVELVDLDHGLLERGHGLGQVRLGVGRDGRDLCRLDGDLGAHLLDARLLLVGDLLLAHDVHEQRVALDGRGLDDLLLGREVDLHLLDLHLAALELREAVRELVARVAHLAPLLGHELAVAEHELEVVGRRHVVVALERRQHLGRGRDDALVRGGEDGGDAQLERRLRVRAAGRGGRGRAGRAAGAGELDVVEELGGHLAQRVLGPGQEPVDGRAVHQRGVHARAVAEARADGRHGQHDVQVRAHALDEERPCVVGHGHGARRDAELLGRRAHGLNDAVLLVLGEEVRHLARVEHVVHVLEEGLLLDLRVREEEHGRLALDARLVVEALEVLVELDEAVLLRDLDREDAHAVAVAVARQEGRHAAQRLAAAAADADEHRVAARRAQDAVDARDVAHGVAEEDEVHGQVARRRVVLGHLLLDDVAQAVEPLLLRVGRARLRVRAAHGGRAAHEVREGRPGLGALLALHERLVLRLDRLVHDLVEHDAEARDVLHGREAVREGAHALVAPEPQEGLLAVEVARVRGQQALHDLGDVAQVKEVVAVHGRRQEGLDDALVDADRGGHDAGHELAHVLGEVRHARREDGLEDGAHLLVGRESEVDDVEAALQPLGDDGAAAARRAHGDDELHVRDVAPGLLRAVVPAAVVEPLAQQLERRLRAEGVLLRHVEVIHEADELLAADGAHLVLGPLLEHALDDVLHRVARGGGREVERELAVRVAGERLELLLRENRLAGARVADDHDRVALDHERVHEEVVAQRVDGRNHDLREGHVARRPPAAGELVGPGPEVARRGVHEVVVHGADRREDGLNLAQLLVELAAAGLVDGAADAPHDAEGEPALGERRVGPGAGLGQRGLAEPIVLREERLEQVAERDDAVELARRHELAAVLAPEGEHARHVLGEEALEEL